MFRSPGAIALTLGPLRIHWYGVVIAAAVLIGSLLAHREAQRRGQDPDMLLNMLVVSLVAALIGARLYYVLFNWSFYAPHPWRMLAIWEGGLAIHGGLLFGVGFGLLLLRWKRMPLGVHLDIVAPCIALGQAMGRWGNFFNQEAFGRPTDLPWKLYIDPEMRPPDYVAYTYFHPTFLYESLWDLGIFALLFFALRKRVEAYPGALFALYLVLYSIGRFAVESLRLDSLMLGPVRQAQVVSGSLVAAGTLAALLLWRRGPRPA